MLLCNHRKGNTPNNTRKTNGKIKRTIASMLAAVMIMSTAATTTAFAAETQDSISTQITSTAAVRSTTPHTRRTRRSSTRSKRAPHRSGVFYVLRKKFCVFCKTVFFVNLL